MDNGTPDFLGRGWSFPPAFDQVRGGVVMAEKLDDIEQSLAILLNTAVGERAMSPEYGCGMGEYLFASLDRTTKSLIEDRVRTAILYYEPRIDAQRVAIDDSGGMQGRLIVEVLYVVRATNSRHNFVFPYYLNEATEQAGGGARSALPQSPAGKRPEGQE